MPNLTTELKKKGTSASLQQEAMSAVLRTGDLLEISKTDQRTLIEILEKLRNVVMAL